MTDDLSGILVVSLEQAVAAPYAAARLADTGARVIKVERPDGDFARDYDTLVHGASAYFVWLNRGKESICLDLKVGADRDLLRAMVAQADVFIQNLKPGALHSLGLGMAGLVESNPKLIGCSISGFGDDGPLSRRKAYDLIVQAEAGLCAITGTAAEPARAGVSVCDIAAGMTAHSAILQALFRRERTGEGRTIHVSLFDALADWMNVPYLQYQYGGFETPRSGVNHPSLAPYGAYAVSDGRQVILSVQNQREWARFCKLVMAEPELAIDVRFATNMERLANRSELDALVADRLSALSLPELVARLEEAGTAYGRLNSIAELATHPQLRRMTVDVAGAEVHVICPGARVDGDDDMVVRSVPAKGEHTDRLRAEFNPTKN